MAESREVQSWSFLTGMVDERKRPSRFLRDRIFGGDVQTLPTESIEIGVLIGTRIVAPFVKRGGQAVEVTGNVQKTYNVIAPNIRIKRHLEAGELLFNRFVGTVIHAQGADVVSGVNAKMAESTRRLDDMVAEAEEYLCAMAIRGVITYQVDEEEGFSITFPRTASHNASAGTMWEQASPNIERDFRSAMKLVSEDAGLNLTDVILGDTATTSFLADTKVLAYLDNRRVTAGELDLMQRFLESGAIFLGSFRSLNVWSYPRAVLLPSGPGLSATTSTDLVRAKYAEFVSVTPAAENVMYYGAIPDLKALGARLFQGRAFSKAWDNEDPSVRYHLLHSRPLPCTRRPDSMVSMQVIT